MPTKDTVTIELATVDANNVDKSLFDSLSHDGYLTFANLVKSTIFAWGVHRAANGDNGVFDRYRVSVVVDDASYAVSVEGIDD